MKMRCFSLMAITAAMLLAGCGADTQYFPSDAEHWYPKHLAAMKEPVRSWPLIAQREASSGASSARAAELHFADHLERCRPRPVAAHRCDLITSLDPLTGKKLWEVAGSTTECVTSAVTDGLLQAASLAKRLLIPQNGSQLLADEGFVKIISGIGMEDVFTNGNRAQKSKESNPRVKDVENLVQAGKPVLLIEYPKKEALRDMVVTQAHEHGYVWLVTDRQLKTLGESGD